MKRILIGVIPGFLVLLAMPYIFIPATIWKSTAAVAHTTQKTAQAFLLDENKWAAWWPVPEDTTAGQETTPGRFFYNGKAFSISHQFFSGIELVCIHEEDSIKSLVSLIPSGKDSVKLLWEYQQQASLNPITRIMQHRRAIRLKDDMGVIIQQLASFISDDQNIYHIKVDLTTVSDTLLITTKSVLNHEPTTADIYGLIDLLQQYIAAAGAKATNPPMLHRRRIDSLQVEVMVALPVNKVLPNAGAIVFKRMVPGNMLVTEVRGGPATVQAAFHQLENYLTDHKYESPAIPFESLITNRVQQPDTTQWFTRICYPVF